MNFVAVTYTYWKDRVQANGWSTYHGVDEENRTVFAGTKDYVLVSHLSGADLDDWTSNFESGSTEVASRGEASLRIGGGLVGEVTTRPNEESRDAFQRQRVSNAASIFESKFVHGKIPYLWNDKTSGAGSEVNFLTDEAALDLVAGTGASDYAITQSKEYVPYEPGKAQQIYLTGKFGNGVSGVIRRAGYFDSDDGLFFEQQGSTFNVVKRSSASGSVVEQRIAQSNWNIDPMDGTGPSGINVDFSKAFLFVIDFQWLGTGRVRYGFFIEGELLFVHEFKHEQLDRVYMAQPSLPVRYEIQNTTSQPSSNSLKQICSTVTSEGGTTRPLSVSFTASSDLNAPTTFEPNDGVVPLVTIRPKQTFNGRNNRVWISVTNSEMICGKGDVFWRLIYNGTLTGASNWSSVNDASAVECNTDATGISGGITIQSGFTTGTFSSTGKIDREIQRRLVLSRGIDITDYDQFTLAVQKLDSGDVGAYGNIIWKEGR